MNVTFDKINDVTVARAHGRLDFAASAGFQAQLEQAVAQGGRGVVLDGSALEYVSSAGLRTFLVVARAAKAKGVGFAVAALQPAVREVFDVSGFARLVAMQSTVDAAVASIAAP